MRSAIFIPFVLCFMDLRAQVDHTRQPEAHGPAVVKTVVQIIQDLCIIDNGIFLRRLAYVESRDGLDRETYSPGYNGGIWKVDKTMFDHTKFADDTLSAAKVGIKMKLSIDWDNVNWTDLRKPLYSGLAATLFIRKYSNFTVPNSLESQALLWKTIYRPQKQVHDFYQATVNLNDCTQSSLLDVALLLDTSSIQSYVNLAEAKIFYQDLINLFAVNEHLTRVAVITFGNTPNVILNFTDNTNLQSVISHLMSIANIQASNPVVYPLPELLDIFKASGRPEAAKYAIMITGSGTGDPMRNLAASGILADEGIQLYTIGIGDQIKDMDLKRITMGPVCTHVKMFPSYEALTTSLAKDIAGLMCHVPLVLKTGVHYFKCGLDTLVRIPRDDNDRTITISVDGGQMDVFGSFKSSIPSKEMYDVIGTPSFGNPLTLYLRNSSDLVINLKGTQLGKQGCSSNYNIRIEPGNNIRGCNNQTADVVFLIDTSSGVKDSDIQLMKTFIIDFIKPFDISQSAMLISIVTYGDTSTNQFWLNGHMTKNDVIQAVQQIKRSTGQRKTGNALSYVRQNSFKQLHGSRTRALHVVISLSEGTPDDMNLVISESKLLQQEGARIIAVGIGSKVSIQDLRLLATDENHMFVAANPPALTTIRAMVINAGCEAVNIICVETGISRNCTGHDIIHSSFGNNLIPNANVQSPCQLGMDNIRFPHPTDKTKFLICDKNGRTLIVLCPYNTQYCAAYNGCFAKCDMTTALTSTTTSPSSTVMSTKHQTTSKATTRITTMPTTTRVTTNPTTTPTTKRVTSPTTTPTTKRITTTQATSTLSSTASQSQVLPNICAKGVPASFPHPFNKQQYFSCDATGHMTLHTCLMTYVFCMENQMCSVSCNTATTVTSQMLQNCVTSPCIHDRLCDKHGVVSALAFSRIITNTRHRYLCKDGVHFIPEAAVLQLCNTGPSRHWIKGPKVIPNSALIRQYTAIASFTDSGYSRRDGVSGVLIGCNATHIKLASQDCKNEFTLQTVNIYNTRVYTRNALNYYVIN